MIRASFQTSSRVATAGAGAGVLTWNKTNWLMTTYAATAPIISADPQSQTNSPAKASLLPWRPVAARHLSLPMVFQHQHADSQCHERFSDPEQCSSHQCRHLFRDGDQHGRFGRQRQCAPHRIGECAVPATIVGLCLRQQQRDFQPHHQWRHRIMTTSCWRPPTSRIGPAFSPTIHPPRHSSGLIPAPAISASGITGFNSGRNPDLSIPIKR